MASATDLLLLQLYFAGSLLGKGRTSLGAHQALDEAAAELEIINYQTLKRALINLKRQGLVRSLREPIITQQGKKRLTRLIPHYQKNRIWDKVLYLIAYDIPETKRRFRNKLRQLLESTGGGLLQASVWITPYNPQIFLKEFTQTPGFSGEIIVSCVGKDGYIGSEDIKSLINRVYRLESINQKYLNFIEKFNSPSGEKRHNSSAAVHYLSILKMDPQLPFELLPSDWAGDEAHDLYCRLTSQGD